MELGRIQISEAAGVSTFPSRYEAVAAVATDVGQDRLPAGLGRGGGTTTIERLQEGPAWIVAMDGEHDVSTVPDLVQELDEAFDGDAPVVVDLSKVEFMDSAILKVLLSARERALGRREHSFALVAPPGGFPSRVLGHVGALIPTYPNRPAALAVLVPGSSSEG